uniref:AGAP004866PAlike [Tribolium castaneum] n=1 Tax=Lepeophtheirus salmonis TaxID=72036 RepID=A0A0K2USI9_LEPSM
MISSFVNETQDEDGNKSVTVTIDDSGKINVDQEVLKSILDSNQQSATVTFVRIGEEEHPPGLNEEGDIILDTEEMTRLEKVLRSDEAKDFLSTVLAQTPTLIQENALTSVSMDGSLEATVVVDVVPPQQPNQVSPIILAQNDSPFLSPVDMKKEGGKMTRRSQRQMDKEMKEEAERIRLENQALMRKELEATQPSPNPPLPPPPPAQSPNTGRPKRERKVPAHLMTGDYESSLLPTLTITNEPPKIKRHISAGKVGPPPEAENEGGNIKDKDFVNNEDDDDEDSGDWNSEDDPERLWCICNQPHNNRFMICCDSCLDWFHGKCVGITKKMGKEMEEASHLWKCPKCTVNLLNAEKTTPTKSQPTPSKKTPIKMKKEELRKKTIVESEKKKERSCFVCDKPPRMNSIFCSDDCISKHANKAKALLHKSRPKASENISQPSANSGKTQVLVIEPNTNTMLNGPNAPTEGTLEVWLKSHPTFHVVMPTSLPTSKFYGNSSKKAPPKVISPHHYNTGNKNIQISPDGSRVLTVKKSPSQFMSSEELREAERKKIQKSLQQHVQKESLSKKIHQQPQKLSNMSKVRKEQPIRAKSPPRKSAPSPPPPSIVDPKPIRANAVKGFYDALKGRLSKVNDVQIADVDLNSLVEEIEESLFRYYNKDVTSKYKAKYRSLVFNIKDEKNTGFFRKIVSRKINSKDLVSLTAEEMANKELQRWREKELKNDIEKIKSHELDMIKLGSKFVMKSHKGEIAIEGEEATTNVSTVVSGANPPLKLPEEINETEIVISSRRKDVIEGSLTWDHGTHEFEPTCDVCNGKKTLEEFLTIKVSKDQRDQKQEKSSKHSKSSSHHHKHDEDRDNRKSESKGSDKKHSSSSKHKGRRRSRSRDRDRKRSSKERKSSSKERSYSSKERIYSSKSRSSSSKDKQSKESSDKSSNSHRRSSRDESKDSSRHTSPSKSSSSRSKHSHKSSKEPSSSSKSSHEKSKTSSSSSSHSSRDDSNKVNKSLGEIWSSKRNDDPPKEDVVVPPDSSETNKKIEEAQKTIANVIKSSIPELTDKSSSYTPVENNDKNNEVVSSTVTIKTPESISTETNPIVWKGDLNMPDVAKFSVTAHQVSGTTDYLTVDLKPLLKIVGRIDPTTVWEYIAKMKESPNKEVLLVRLEPTSEDEKTPYMSFFNYLLNRNRFGVVGDSTGKVVKDCYILPLGATQTVHNCMLPYEGPGLEFLKSNMLLALIVRGKRKRAADYQPIKPNSQSYNPQKSKVQILDMAPSEFTELRDTKSGTNPRKRDSEQSYTPVLSKGKYAKKSEDNEVYDPESAFPEEANSSTKRKKVDVNNPKFSDEEDNQNISEPRPITSTSGGFTEKLAQLTAEIEMQKKEINSIENTINSKSVDTHRDPRHKSTVPSRLSNMTDEDLMAKAQEMLDLQNSSSGSQTSQELVNNSTAHMQSSTFNMPQTIMGVSNSDQQTAVAWNNSVCWNINPNNGPWPHSDQRFEQIAGDPQNTWNNSGLNSSQYNNHNSNWYDGDGSSRGGGWTSNRNGNRKRKSPSPSGNFSNNYRR